MILFHVLILAFYFKSRKDDYPYELRQNYLITTTEIGRFEKIQCLLIVDVCLAEARWALFCWHSTKIMMEIEKSPLKLSNFVKRQTTTKSVFDSCVCC